MKKYFYLQTSVTITAKQLLEISVGRVVDDLFTCVVVVLFLHVGGGCDLNFMTWAVPVIDVFGVDNIVIP